MSHQKGSLKHKKTNSMANRKFYFKKINKKRPLLTKNLTVSKDTIVFFA